MKTNITLLFLFFNYFAWCQIVTIPDPIFKSNLVNNSFINTNSDTEIQVSEANAYTGQINVNLTGVSSLVGIEAFINLTSLQAAYNSVSSIDLSNNTALTTLNLANNLLTSIDISNCTQLVSLNLNSNDIANIDLSANSNLNTLLLEGNLLSNLDISNCTSLENLLISYNTAITIIDFSAFNTLMYFTAIDVPLIAVDLSNQTNLRSIDLENASLSTVDLTNNPNLESVYIRNCNLTTIDLSQNPLLESVDLTSNFLTSLDLSNKMNLLYAYLGNNTISNLNLTGSVNLEELFVANSQLTTLDVSGFPNLYRLAVQGNQLTQLNVKNNNNSNFTTFFAQNNPSLACIQVDDEIYSQANWTNIDPTASFANYCSWCTVNIPDPILKAALLNNTAINTNSDSEIQCLEANAYTGGIVLNNLGITDATGLESFTNILMLSLIDNNLLTIDLSSNTMLETVYLDNNNISTIVLDNPNLTTFFLSNNSLSVLNLSNCPNLTNLDISFNQLSTIDITANTDLVYLYFNNNGVTSMDFSTNANLISIDGSGNQLSSVDISMNNNLQSAYFLNNSLASIQLPTLGTTLSQLNLSSNNLINLDLSTYTAMTSLSLGYNELISLNIANGNNTSIIAFNAANNPNLLCIEVDDVAYSTSNWTSQVDPQSTFSVDCSASLDENTDDLFAIYPNPTNGSFTIDVTEKNSSISIFSVQGQLLDFQANNKFSKYNFDLSNYENGYYFILIEIEGNKFIEKLNLIK